jgi:hypothetical protein
VVENAFSDQLAVRPFTIPTKSEIDNLGEPYKLSEHDRLEYLTL